MPIDSYKMSIEARPLRILYSKYNSTDSATSLQIIRPLGRIRKVSRRSPPEVHQPEQQQLLPKFNATDTDLVHTDNNARISETKSSQEFPSECIELGKSYERMDNIATNDTESYLPIVSSQRSRVQAFEHKFRIAAARQQLQESPSSTSSAEFKDYNRKVIQLPLFRINLKTYTGDAEISKTLAHSRESLRKLMELHKSKLKSANVITANIRNYEFMSPPSTSAITSRSSEAGHSGTGIHTIGSFPAKPSSRSPRRAECGTKIKYIASKHSNNCTNNKAHLVTFADDSASDNSIGSDREVIHDLSKYGDVTTTDETNPNDGETDDDSSLSIAIPPDTSFTLASTLNHIDKIIKSPRPDDLDELENSYRATELQDCQPAWPSYEDIQKLSTRGNSRRSGNASRTSLSRPGTVLTDSYANKYPQYDQNGHKRNVTTNQTSHTCHGTTSQQKPVLRYTSNVMNYDYKLKGPIIVPSHTHDVCPMCNIYQRETSETPCPPNSPMSNSMYLETPFINTNEPLQISSRSAGKRSVTGRTPVKHEVLRLSRINLSGSPTDERSVISYMKV